MLFETRKLDKFEHSNFKFHQTQTRWFVFKANSNSIILEILEIFRPNLGKLVSKLELNSRNGRNLNLLCVQTRRSEAQWNSNSRKSGPLQPLIRSKVFLGLYETLRDPKSLMDYIGSPLRPFSATFEPLWAFLSPLGTLSAPLSLFESLWVPQFPRQ